MIHTATVMATPFFDRLQTVGTFATEMVAVLGFMGVMVKTLAKRAKAFVQTTVTPVTTDLAAVKAKLAAELPTNGLPVAVKVENLVRQQVLFAAQMDQIQGQNVLNDTRADTAVTLAGDVAIKIDALRGYQDRLGQKIEMMAERLEVHSEVVKAVKDNQAEARVHLNRLLQTASEQRDEIVKSIVKLQTEVHKIKPDLLDEMAERTAEGYELLAEHGGPDLRFAAQAPPTRTVTTTSTTSTTDITVPPTEPPPAPVQPPAEGSP